MVKNDRQPKIISLGFATPERVVKQKEAFQALGYRSERVKAIFENSGIDQRHVWVAPEKLSHLSWQELTEEYQKGARFLSGEAVKNCLDSRDINDVSCIVFCSVSGYTCPSMSYFIAKDLHMREDIVHSNILGQGCEAAVPALKRAYDFINSTGKPALAVATEICSASYFPAPENDLENTVSNAIFADASVAAWVGYDDDPKHPEIIDFESQFDGDHVVLLGYRWQDGRLKVVLGKDVPKVVPKLAAKAVDRLLSRNKLTKNDISHWILHPGGVKVLEGLEDEVGLTREQTKHSWEVLREYGNVSSATIGIIGKITQRAETSGGYGLVVTIGAGTACDAMLVKWG
jgi:predicted naringenin-chalcone synthase